MSAEQTVLTREQARALVARWLEDDSPKVDLHVIVDRFTLERPFGWVFFYQSKRCLETGDRKYRLVGNGPRFVNKHDGSRGVFTTGGPIEESIAEYERDLERARSLGLAPVSRGPIWWSWPVEMPRQQQRLTW